MKRLLRPFMSAICLVCAPFLLFLGQANAGNPISPAFAWNGFNLAYSASASVMVAQDQEKFSMTVNPAAVALARRAFAAEPLATDALFVLAVDRLAKGDQAGLQAILAGAEALDKRNRNIGALQLSEAVNDGDLQGTFAIVDRLATVSPDLAGNFVQPLIASLDSEAAMPELQAALERQPAWAAGFWQSVPSEPQRVGRMYALRQRIDFGTDAESDAQLLAGLVASGRFSEAFAFWRQVSGDEDNATGFVQSASYPPIGWQFVSSAERSMTPRGDTQYDIYIQNEIRGELGRQLLQLSAGQYRFSANVTPVSEAVNVTARLDCADSPDIKGEEKPLDAVASWTVSGDCNAYWLVLTGDGWGRREPLRLGISAMRLQAGS